MTLSERCAKAPGFRWMAGMLAVECGRDWRVSGIDGDWLNLDCGHGGQINLPRDCMTPNLTDPATLACIQWLARERHDSTLRSESWEGVHRLWVASPAGGAELLAMTSDETTLWVMALEVQSIRERFVYRPVQDLRLPTHARIELVQEDNDEFRPTGFYTKGPGPFAYNVPHSALCDSAYLGIDWDVWRKGEWSGDDGGDCTSSENNQVFIDHELRHRLFQALSLSAFGFSMAGELVVSRFAAALEEVRPWVPRENDEFRPLAVYVGRSIWDSSMDSKNPRNQCDSGWRYNDCYDDYLGALCQTGGDCQSEAA